MALEWQAALFVQDYIFSRATSLPGGTEAPGASWEESIRQNGNFLAVIGIPCQYMQKIIKIPNTGEV